MVGAHKRAPLAVGGFTKVADAVVSTSDVRRSRKTLGGRRCCVLGGAFKKEVRIGVTLVIVSLIHNGHEGTEQSCVRVARGTARPESLKRASQGHGETG